MRLLLSAHRKKHKQSPYVCYDACRAYSKVTKAKKGLESAWYENMREYSVVVPGTMPRNAVLVMYSTCSTCCSRLHCWNCIFLFSRIYQLIQECHMSGASRVDTSSHALSDSNEFFNFDLFSATPNTIKKQPSNSSSGDGWNYISPPIFHSPLLDHSVLQEAAGRSCYSRIWIKLIPKGEDIHATLKNSPYFTESTCSGRQTFQ